MTEIISKALALPVIIIAAIVFCQIIARIWAK